MSHGSVWMGRSRRGGARFPVRGLVLLLGVNFTINATSPLYAVAIPTVPVGNPGNVPDAEVMVTDGTTGYGAVAYNYRIGTTEVTNAQYVEFLNAKAASDPLWLYDPSMGSDPRGGITRSGDSGSYSYAFKANMGNKPVNFVNWYDAIRFANWLHNGQGAGDTENGAYTLGPLAAFGVPVNEASVSRNPGAVWYLPNENEWYKAAYYDPTLAGGFGGYWNYPTQSDTPPTSATSNSVGDISNPGPNVANLFPGTWTGANWNGQEGHVTTVGSAGPLSSSHYGTFDQGGNLMEFNETLISGLFVYRGMRGGSWSSTALSENAQIRLSQSPFAGSNDYGFRVATVPEPGAFALAMIAVAVVAVAMAWARTERGARRTAPAINSDSGGFVVPH